MPLPILGSPGQQIRHGYTLRDLHDITSVAARLTRVTKMRDYRERWDMAWEGVIDTLYADSDQPPSRTNLIYAGRAALGLESHRVMRQRGYADDRDPSSTGPTLPRFLAYWSGRGISPLEERSVERVAIWQVVNTLRPILRDAVDAFADCGDYELAAQQLGIEHRALRARLTKARRQVLALWHEGETPAPQRIDKRVSVAGGELDTHCHAGHEWSLDNTRWRPRRINSRIRMERDCRACERIRRARTRARAGRQGATAARQPGDPATNLG